MEVFLCLIKHKGKILCFFCKKVKNVRLTDIFYVFLMKLFNNQHTLLKKIYFFLTPPYFLTYNCKK